MKTTKLHCLLWSLIVYIILETKNVSGNKIEIDEEPLNRVKRVVNGDEIEIAHWPWLVHLWAKTKTGSFFNRQTTTHYCGGSIIADRWILSAAHCFKHGPGVQITDLESRPPTVVTGGGLSKSVAQIQIPNTDMSSHECTNLFSRDQLMRRKKWHVRSGEGDWKCDLLDGVKHVFCRIFKIARCRCHLHNEKIFVHPEYNPQNLWNNDIALIKLEDGILSRHNTGIIRLPPRNVGTTWPQEGSICVAKGWGCTRGSGPVVRTARGVKLPVYPNGRCAVYYSGASNPLDTNTRLCAYEYGSSICSGDSGGPLVCKNENNEWIQAGVISFAASRYQEYSPSVFARVSNYRSWIEQIIINN